MVWLPRPPVCQHAAYQTCCWPVRTWPALGDYGNGVRVESGNASAWLARCRPIGPSCYATNPTAHLDSTTADALAAELRVATSGRTALIVTHRPEQISGLPEIRLSPAAVRDPCNAPSAG